MDLSFFAEMAWKSALISGAALVLAFFLRSRSAADRALVLRIGVGMLLLLPPIAMMLPALQIEAWAAPEAPVLSLYMSADVALSGYAASAMPAAEPTIWDDPTPLVILAYLGGLLMAGSRLFAGLWLLGRWTRDAREVSCPEWRSALDRNRWLAARPERIRLMVSNEVHSPLSWGWRRPVILIDGDTLDDPAEADAILAHEVAHIARRDWPVLMLSRIAATLFWFNPLVWLLEREIIQQAEEAADCEAAQRVEPARYAQTLLAWAQIEARTLPAHSIAPMRNALARRVQAVLDRGTRERQSGSAWTALAMLLCVAVTVPVAAMELVEAAPAPPAAPVAPGRPGAPLAPPALAAPAIAPGAVPTVAPLAVPQAPLPPVAMDFGFPGIAPRVNSALAVTLPRVPAIVATALAAAHPHPGWDNLSEEEREEMMEERREAQEEAGEARREAAEARAEALGEAAEARTEALAEATEARMAARTVHRVDVSEAVRQARSAAHDAQRQVRISMRHGADGMMRGAEGMERGARQMDAEAQRLRTDRAYRERKIAEARARGERVTHQDLLEAADSLREGAQGLREGAQGMRESARGMAEGDH